MSVAKPVTQEEFEAFIDPRFTHDKHEFVRRVWAELQAARTDSERLDKLQRWANTRPSDRDTFDIGLHFLNGVTRTVRNEIDSLRDAARKGM